MSASTNKATVRQAIEEQVGSGDLSALEAFYTPDFAVHDPANPQLTDLASNMRFIAELRAAYPDAAVSIEDQIAEGDRVATRWVFRGTNAEPFPGITAVGQPVELTGITIARLRGGRIAEEWVVWDALGFMRQVGLLPKQGSEGS